MNITEPVRGLVPSYASSRALPQPGPGGLMNPAAQMAVRGSVLRGGPNSSDRPTRLPQQVEIEPSRRGGWLRRPTPP